MHDLIVGVISYVESSDTSSANDLSCDFLPSGLVSAAYSPANSNRRITMQTYLQTSNHPTRIRNSQRVPNNGTQNDTTEDEDGSQYDNSSNQSGFSERLNKSPAGRRPARSDQDMPNYRR